MSHLVECKTNMRNKKTLMDALGQLGVPENAIEVAEGTPIKLNGYLTQTANVDICVRKEKYHNGYGDVGFSVGSDGNYVVHVDDMDDIHSLASLSKHKSFSGGVKQWYAACAAKTALKKQGLATKIHKNDDGKLVIVGRG